MIKNLKFKIKNCEGMSLLEILVVVAIFAILGIITTQAVILTIGGSKKSESLVKVRENISYSMGVIERQVRNANSIIQCPNMDANVLDYSDSSGTAASFTCIGIGSADGFVASGSARLTSSEINLTGCSFTCVPGTSTNPSSVTVNLEATDKNSTGVQNSKVSTSTQIYLRNY